MGRRYGVRWRLLSADGPFAPIVERVIYSGSLYEADRAMILIPMAALAAGELPSFWGGLGETCAGLYRRGGSGRSASFIPQLVRVLPFHKGSAS
jgi:hypothetical protein